MNDRKTLGNRGETLASQFLQQKKLTILDRNLKTKFGEIDILAKDDETLVLVEVKAKTSDKYGSAIEMITPAKQRKLVLLACELQMKYQSESVRIDVVTVENAKTMPQLKHYPGVIEYHAG
jgi:putative endonuclease